MTAREQVEVAVVGGGPAGAAVAALLGAAGRDVVVLERNPGWRWRACGVFSSPATVRAVRRLGADAAGVAAIARRIPAMRVEAPSGARFRLTYGDDGSLTSAAVGFDRAALDPVLLGLARDRGADVREGVTVTSVDFAHRTAGAARRAVLGLRQADGAPASMAASFVIGAEGRSSVVAAAAGVPARPPLGDRVGLTYHVADPDGGPHDARMVILDDAYVGLAPVPGARINVGIVLGRRWRGRLRHEGADRVARRIEALAGLGRPERCDAIAGAAPLATRVRRRAGDGWLLVGDAAGFLDPFTGEGLHRALVSAELAAETIEAAARRRAIALDGYDRAMTARFRSKDIVSLVVQAFLARPVLFEYAARRLAARDGVRETMGLVMGDLVPASRALDPRYLARLLRP